MATWVARRFEQLKERRRDLNWPSPRHLNLKPKMNAVPFMFASKSLSLLTSTVGDSHSSISDYDLVRIQSEIKKWSEDVGVQQKDSRKLILKIMDLLEGDGSGEKFI